MRSPKSLNSAGSSSRNHRRHGGHAASSSLLLSADKPVAAALATLLVIYSVVTLATYSKVALMDDTTAVRQQTLTVTGVERVLSHTSEQQQQQQPVPSAPQDQQQQQQQLPASVAAAAAAVPHKPPFAGPDAIRLLQTTFPTHVGADIQEILHPGYQILSQEKRVQKWPADLPTMMQVPTLFDESYGSTYGTRTIRDYLGLNLLTPATASQIGSHIRSSTTTNGGGTTTTTNMMLETIYCSVASYRDPECTGTVADLFARAEHPERIRVAIIDQRIDGDPICAVPHHCDDILDMNGDTATTANTTAAAADNAILCRYRHLLDRYEMDARYAVGPVFARHLAHRHYRGEYFAMQIDSHVRFIEHWDADIIGQWKSAKNEMAVLATYLSDISDSINPVTHTSQHPNRPIMCQSDFEGSGAYRHLRHGQQPEGIPGIANEPTLHPFWAAGFSFARGHFVIQVPYDQYLPMVFQGEEISIGLRGFTYGYDYYAPERGVCFHMYAIKENTAKRKSVPLFWENGALYGGVGTKAMKRLNAIIGMEDYDDSEYITDERPKYGLGQVRSTQKFFDTFGIHIKQHTVEKHLCRFVGKPMMREFLPALRRNGMGLDYDKITYKFVDPDTINPPVHLKKGEQFKVAPKVVQ